MVRVSVLGREVPAEADGLQQIQTAGGQDTTCVEVLAQHPATGTFLR